MADITDEEKVKRVTIDNQTTEMHDLKDQIAWDQYKNTKEAAGKGKFGGVRFAKGINPGTA